MRDYYTTVRQMLLDYPETRDDDMLLYANFLMKFKMVDPCEGFLAVMCTAKQRKLPSYESITRARRKVQEKEPLLQGKRRKARMEEEAIFHEYYRNH